MPSTWIPWIIALGLSMGPAVSNGLARFAYGLVLPGMQADLGWSYTEAGWLNTANGLGYLAGALLTFTLVDRVGARRLFASGMIVTPLLLAGSSGFSDLMMQSVFRIAAGVAGAAAFVSGGAMVSMLFGDDLKRNALAVSIYFGGGGFGMLASGAVIPILMDLGGSSAWPLAWQYLAVSSALLVIPALFAAWFCPQPLRRKAATYRALPLQAMVFAVTGYFLFAVGYIVYLTFLVPLLHTQASSPLVIAMIWSLMGLAVMVAPIVWRGILFRSDGGGALALVCLATGVATLLPLILPGSVPALFLSVTVFGLSFFMAPTAVTNFAKKNLTNMLWGRALAAFTTIFATGQILGPMLAGAISDATGALENGMATAGSILLAGGVVAWLQRPLSRL